MSKLIIIFAIVATGLSGADVAEPADTIVIDASGLDTPTGAKRFRHALGNALDQLCGSYAATEQYQWYQIDKCRARAMKSVDEQMAAIKRLTSIRLAVQ